jgi:hypothetical protein
LDLHECYFRPPGAASAKDAFVEVSVFLDFVIPDESRRLTPLERPG